MDNPTCCLGGGLLGAGIVTYFLRKKLDSLENAIENNRIEIHEIKGFNAGRIYEKSTNSKQSNSLNHHHDNKKTHVAEVYSNGGCDGDSKVGRYVTPPQWNVRRLTSDKKVWKLVLTGGPCAGKSTALATVKSFLQSRGFFVATVSESATFLHNNGVAFYPKEPLMFQIAVTSTQRDHEVRIMEFCKQMAQRENCNAIVLCDRGIQDGRSYCTLQEWQTVLETVGLPPNENQIRSLYDGVFHLVTAADGAQRFYTKTHQGKQIRHEEPEQAIALDRKLQKAWNGHPYHHIIRNKGTFDDKLKHLLKSICKLLAIPQTRRQAKKFILKSMPQSFPAVGLNNMSTSRFIKTYITMAGSKNPMKSSSFKPKVMFVRERTQQGLDIIDNDRDFEFRSYTLKIISMEGSQQIESVRSISKREYKDYLRFADPSRHVIHQNRIQFSFQSRFYEVVEYLDSDLSLSELDGKPLLLLNIRQSEDDPAEITLEDVPDFLDAHEDVTNNKRYSAHYLSKKYPGSGSPTVLERFPSGPF